jgi:hypothetical protein
VSSQDAETLLGLFILGATLVAMLLILDHTGRVP